MADTQTPAPAPIKPGTSSTEFWGMLLSVIVPMIPTLAHVSGPATDAWVQIGTALAAALASGAYSIGRSNVKSAAITAGRG